MPRQARIDIPGQLYHVMSRGIERRRIFIDDEDHADFRDRVCVWLQKTGSKCLAWCLMPNHFHFLVLRGSRPLSEMMHHVMTGYAVNFNLRHGRAGHLFQNRYKAIICELERYLLELVPYIHLNPLRARLVADLAGLKGYKWCGHGAVVTGVLDDVLDRGELLRHFDSAPSLAVAKYAQIMAEKAAEAGRQDLSGGGMLRSAGGRESVLKAFRAGEKVFSDQRVLGGSAFVESVLKGADVALNLERKSRAEVLADVEKLTGISKMDILRHSHERGPSRARAVYCFRCAVEAGSTGRELALELGLSSGAVSKLVAKGSSLELGR